MSQSDDFWSHTLNIAACAGLCLVWSRLTLTTNKFASLPGRDMWQQHQTFDRCKRSPCTSSTAHILLSTTPKTAKNGCGCKKKQKPGSQLKAWRLLKGDLTLRSVSTLGTRSVSTPSPLLSYSTTLLWMSTPKRCGSQKTKRLYQENRAFQKVAIANHNIY